MNPREHLLTKYGGYEANGHHIFTVTLSTYVKSEAFCRMHFSKIWERDFVYRIQRNLPHKLRNKFDHDFVAEKSPDNHFHFHGLLAFADPSQRKIWKDDGLSIEIKRDLDSLKSRGDYRSASINKYLIEPVRSGELVLWVKYITKSPEIPTSSFH